MNNNFHEQLKNSYKHTDDDIALIRKYFMEADKIMQASVDLDICGADYQVCMPSNNQVYVDVKRRFGGDVKKYSKHGEIELALETYSVVPDENHDGRLGWTRDSGKITDYVLYVFDDDVCDVCYMIPYQLLRSAFRRNYFRWLKDGYDLKRQSQKNADYKSEAMFVPASVVIKAVTDEMKSSL